MFTRRPPLLVGVVAAALGVALTTLLVFALSDVAPVLSLGVVYLLIVLVVASFWGAWLGLATAVPARSRSTSSTSRRPAGSRSPAARTGSGWPCSSSPRCWRVAGPGRAPAGAGGRAAPPGGRPVGRDGAAAAAAAAGWRRRCRRCPRGSRGRSACPAPRSSCAPSTRARAASSSRCARARARSGRSCRAGAPEPVLRRIQVRIVPALEALLAAALERDALMADAVETAALRRSDVIKTALLRSVSHDLRSPLTAILDLRRGAGLPILDESEREELVEAVAEEATGSRA